MSVRAWKGINENVKVYCVTADQPSEAFAQLSMFCQTENIRHVSAVTVSFWDEDDRYSVNLYY